MGYGLEKLVDLISEAEIASRLKARELILIDFN